MILLTNSDNGEATFPLLLEHILGDTVTPWEWEGYTQILTNRSAQNSRATSLVLRLRHSTFLAIEFSTRPRSCTSGRKREFS
jgi:hypothetical protein